MAKSNSANSVVPDRKEDEVAPVVELRKVTKKFPGVVALRNVDIEIEPGEIHGLVGENGSGKSTLINVLTGVYTPEEGEIYVDGIRKKFSSPEESQNAGIACVYQETNIVPQLSLTDNIFMNKFVKSRFGLLDYGKMHAKVTELLGSMGVEDIDVTRPASNFGVGLLQMVEIAKALLTRAKLVVLDEPTASLSEGETEQLSRIVRDLKASGVSIIFVSHKLDEIFALCDRVTVLRDGERIFTDTTENLDSDKLIRAMVGSENADARFTKPDSNPGKVALELKEVTSVGSIRKVSFQARYGEILGFFGLVGAGRTETMRAIFGDLPIDSGQIYLDGRPVRIDSPQRAVEDGIAFITEDRRRQGLVLNQSTSSNLILAALSKVKAKGTGLLDGGKIKIMTDNSVRSMKIKTNDVQNQVSKLSGGNQQKVVIGKWVNSAAEIYIFDEPTRGIDVGAKVEVYNIMSSLVAAGKCVVMVSSELSEVLAVSDRLIVMRDGEVMAEIERDSPDFNEEDVMRAAWGERAEDAAK